MDYYKFIFKKYSENFIVNLSKRKLEMSTKGFSRKKKEEKKKGDFLFEKKPEKNGNYIGFRLIKPRQPRFTKMEVTEDTEIPEPPSREELIKLDTQSTEREIIQILLTIQRLKKRKV